MIRLLELFGGIGACSAAFDRLGIEYEIADYVEIDKYAVASYNAIHGTSFEPQDISKWDKDIEVDLIMHGSPCQSISIAGLQHGADEGSGTRSSLMWETVRIVTKLKPKYVIWENVKNLLSDTHVHNYGKYLKIMEEMGYANYYKVMNSKDYGVPQNRERIFTVSILDGKAYDFPEEFPLEIRLKDILEPIVDERYYLSDKALKGFYRHNEHHMAKGTGFIFKPKNPDEDVASCLRANAALCATDNTIAEPVDPYIVASRGRQLNVGNGDSTWYQTLEPRTDGITNTLTSVDKDNYVAEPQLTQVGQLYGTDTEPNPQAGRVYSVDGISPTMDTCSGGNRMPKVLIENEENPREATELQRAVCNKAIEDGLVQPNDVIEYTYSNARLSEMENGYINTQNKQDNSVMSTLVTKPEKLGVVVGDVEIPSNVRIRKLTPLECWRLQGFSDEYFNRAKSVNSDTQLYKQAGNSITVDVLYYIIQNLLCPVENNKSYNTSTGQFKLF